MKQFQQCIYFIVFKSLRSSVSEGIRAVDERMSKQEDIRGKKVRKVSYSSLQPGLVTGSTLREGTVMQVAGALRAPLQRTRAASSGSSS